MASQARDEVIHIKIPSNPLYVSTVRRTVGSISRNLGFPDEVIEDIELSVAEAVSNAVEHGSPSNHDSTITVAFKISSEHLTIDVRDEGPGFNLPTGETVDDNLNERGRGLRLIYKLMDNVRVCNTVKGSRISMKKCRSSEKSENVKTSV